MRIWKTNFFGNANVGLFGYATDTYCLVGGAFEEMQLKQIEKVLNVPVHQLTIAGTELLGVFLSGNARMLLVPHIAFEHELEGLRRLHIPYQVINTTLTCLGNNILCNDRGALINKEYEGSAREAIASALGVGVEEGTLLGLNTLGALIAHHASKGLIPPGTSDDERNAIEEVLDIEVDEGTVNMGTPYLRSGILCNSHGMVIGAASGGPEIVNADEVLYDEKTS